MRPYWQDLSDAEFEALLPPKISRVLLTPGKTSPHDMPANAILAKIERLTRAINSTATTATGDFQAARVLQGPTFHAPDGRAVTDVEVWYHRGGASRGKVLRVQVSASRTYPFVAMTAARVVGTIPEDQIVLLDGLHSVTTHSYALLLSDASLDWKVIAGTGST